MIGCQNADQKQTGEPITAKAPSPQNLETPETSIQSERLYQEPNIVILLAAVSYTHLTLPTKA